MRILIFLCNAAALYESGLGVAQAFGWRASRHLAFGMTGTFANPGPYGGCVAVMLSVLAAFIALKKDSSEKMEKALVWLSAASCCMCVVVLPASMSRAAWLALAVAAICFGFKEMGLGGWLRRHGWLGAGCALVVAALIVGAFFLKKDSAVGRLHIWHMELKAMAESPWMGHGSGSVLGAYGDAQAEYFASGERPALIVRVAGCPEFAFNEYFKVGVEHGIPAMLAVVVAAVTLILLMMRRHSPFAYGLIAFAVFAFFSYPLSCFRIKGEAEKGWENIRYLSEMELYEDAVEEYEPLYPELKDNYRFLYDYGYALYKTSHFEESIRVLTEGAKISSDPMFHNIIGRDFESLGRCDEAEAHYVRSHHMVPSRLYPLTLLMEMKVRGGDREEARVYAERILSMPVNERNRNMVMLRDGARRCLDTLEVAR